VPNRLAGARAALDAIGQLPDVEIDIAGAALQFARLDEPDADWEAAAEHLSELARDAVSLARDMGGDDVAARAGALAGLITGRYRYAGDTESYDDPANANLIRVTERRRGLPVSLGIVWLHCARATGWGAHGVDFPGHFLLALEGVAARGRVQSGPQQTVLDVFAGGVPLDAKDLRNLLKRVAGPDAELRPGVLAPMSARRTLLRLQDNIRSRRLAGSDVEGALRCTLDMLRIAPDLASLWREAAAMHQQLDQVSAALRCYTRLLDLVPEGDSAVRARLAIDDLRSRLN
jgi:regulator of sirC expression with transglutaminase-like and TPR domain